MLRDKLYTLCTTETAGESFTAQLRLLPESEIYAAHFRGMPVTPGACLVQMACELAGMWAGKPLDIVEAADIRFLYPILPDRDLDLTLKLERDGEGNPWRVQVYAGETLCARMKLTLEA